MKTPIRTQDNWTPRNEEDRQVVRDELERILESAPFRSSRRYPALLRFMVGRALASELGDLKERTIGVQVFDRKPAYDTNADPVVRFSAGEVRKRIAQFYQENQPNGPVRISVPLGTYIPQFSWVAADVPVDSAETAEQAPRIELLTAAEQALEPISTEQGRLSPVDTAAPAPAPQKDFIALGVLIGAIAMLLCGGLFFGLARFQHRSSAIMRVWEPVLSYPEAVLISAGRPLPEGGETALSPDMTIRQHFFRPEFRISIRTTAAIAQVAGFLYEQHKRFRLHEASSNSLQDLRGRPVILMNGNDNIWTVRLLKPLRFHFVQTGDFSYIEDAQHPEKHDWNVDFSKPYLQQTTDYAIVARFYDETTGAPAVVVAGISSNGTDAAGEFLSSAELLEAFARTVPRGSLDRNFEAVLKVEVVGGNTGAASVVASHFW